MYEPNIKSVESSVEQANKNTSIDISSKEDKMLSYAHEYANIKQSRKQVEQDAQMLANRIAILKKEEENTWKKIDETRKRSKQVLKIKQNQEEKINNKVHFEMQKQMALQRANQQLNEMRHARKQSKKVIQHAVLQSKRDKVNKLKILSLDNERKLQEKLFNIDRSNKLAVDIIKKKRIEGKQKIEQFKKDKINRWEKSYEIGINENVIMRSKKENEVSDMEIQEMELIKRIQNAQDLQKSAQSDLENALSSSPQEASKNINDINSNEDFYSTEKAKMLDNIKIQRGSKNDPMGFHFNYTGKNIVNNINNNSMRINTLTEMNKVFHARTST